MPREVSSATQKVLEMMNAKSPRHVIKNISLWRWFSNRIDKMATYVNRTRIYRKSNQKESTRCVQSIHSDYLIFIWQWPFLFQQAFSA